MKVEVAYIFKTPLDPDYNNVFDDYNSVADYYNYLYNNYRHLRVITSGTTERSIKIVDNRFILVVKKEHSQIYDFNYGYLQNSDALNNKFFFFIESSESSNDGTNPSTILHCKLDAFANSIFDLSSTSYDDTNMINRRHYELTSIDTSVTPNVLRVNNYLTVEEGVSRKIDNADSPTGIDRKVLFIQLRVKNDCYHTVYPPFIGSTITTVKGANSVEYSPSAPVFYIPVCVCYFVGLNDPIVDTQYVEAGCYTSTNEGTREFKSVQMIRNGRVIGINLDSDRIISADLTFYSPVKYKLEVDEQTETGRVIIENALWRDGVALNYLADKSLGVVLLSTEDRNDYLAYQYHYLLADYLKQPVMAYTIAGNLGYPNHDFNIDVAPIVTPVTSRNSVIDSLNYGDEPRLLMYPFRNFVAHYNGAIHDIIPHFNQKVCKFSINFKSKTSPTLSFGETDEIPYAPKEDLESNGEVIRTTDSLEYFMRNNGSKLLSGVLKTAVAPITVGVSMQGRQENTIGRARNASLINSAVSLIDTEASLVDIERQSDVYSFPQIDAFNDLKQNSIRIATARIRDTIAFNALFFDFHYYGYHINRNASLRSNTHDQFDYVRTQGCHLSFITNPIYRAELEAAYDRGITRWHLSAPITSDPTANLQFKNFNRRLANWSKNKVTVYGG